jgi:hypothetical protein
MRALLVAVIVCAPAVASADDGDEFVQGVVGYTSPIAGVQYSDAIAGGARVGIRAGRSLATSPDGKSHLSLEFGFDWRPVKVDGSTEQNLRLLVGPRLTFTADPLEIYFRAAIGYDHLYLSEYVNRDGIALEPGFGAAFRRQGLVLGAEVAVPVSWHPEHQGSDYMDGYAGADLQTMAFAGATF